MQDILKFFKRYWWVFLALGVSIALFLTPSVFLYLGTLVFVPVLGTLVALLALAFRAIFNRDTTYPYATDGDVGKGFDHEFWNELTPAQRVWFTGIQIWVYLLVGALVTIACLR